MPIDIGDLAALMALDRVYSVTAKVEPVVDRASVHFYQRSGHSFAARDLGRAGGSPGDLSGFVLAHASWSGGRPVVRVERLAVAGDVEGVAPALVEAIVKSAYDAGVYDVVAAVPTSDEVASSALRGSAFLENDLSFYVRVLGSRGSSKVGG